MLPVWQSAASEDDLRSDRSRLVDLMRPAAYTDEDAKFLRGKLFRPILLFRSQIVVCYENNREDDCILVHTSGKMKINIC